MKSALYFLIGLLLIIEDTTAFHKIKTHRRVGKKCWYKENCVQCEEINKRVCCPSNKGMQFCCSWLLNSFCTPTEVYNSTSVKLSHRIHKVRKQDPIVVVHHAYAKLRNIDPNVPGSIKLKIAKRDDSTFATVQLSGVKSGRYLVNYGVEFACGYNFQKSKPLITSPIKVDQDNEVTLTVPSLDDLKNQPVALLQVPQNGPNVPVGCGIFVVI